MNQGKKFEQNFAKSVPKDVYFMRIKDTVSSYSHGSGSSFTSNNPFDCFMLYNGFFLPMELKSSKENRFSVQTEDGKTGYDIKLHQIKSLTKAQQFDNVMAGFVLDFRCGNTYWISILDFNDSALTFSLSLIRSISFFAASLYCSLVYVVSPTLYSSSSSNILSG